MGAIRPPRRVNLICGLISNDLDLMARAIQLMTRQIGPIDEATDSWPFDMTDYYELEMGENLQRRFVSFERLIDPGELPGLKVLTNSLEADICRDLALPKTQRPVNLDPGYLALSKLVLATTKDYNHRIYLRDGIYAECTLRYTGGRWESWPWTYPDYGDGRYHEFFDRVRERLKTKLGAGNCGSEPLRGDQP